jgi:hypothetical protein
MGAVILLIFPLKKTTYFFFLSYIRNSILNSLELFFLKFLLKRAGLSCLICPFRLTCLVWPVKVSLNRSGGQFSLDRSQPGQASLDRHAWKGQIGQILRDRSALTDQTGQVSKDISSRTGQPGLVSLDRSVRQASLTGQLGQASESGHPGQGSLAEADGTSQQGQVSLNR